MKLIFTFFLLPCFLFFSTPNNELAKEYNPLKWKLKKEKQGIKVFTRDIIGSNLKELKIMMSFKRTSFSKILDLLNQAHQYKDWVYKCSESKMVGVPTETESISYYKFDFPWPLSDRDAYMKSVVERDPTNNRMYVTTTSLPSFGVEQEDVIRIQQHYNRWEFEQKSETEIALTYYLRSNPGGRIPDWAINMAVDRGPTNSLSNFRTLLKAN